MELSNWMKEAGYEEVPGFERRPQLKEGYFMLRLRPYQPRDAEAVVSWIGDEAAFRRWSADRFPAYPIGAEDLNRHYEAMAASDCFYAFTAFDEAGAAGHLIMRFVDEKKTVLRFGFVIVDPKKRGKGYGREMLGLAARYAFDCLKAEEITLGVFENNAPAYRCYRAAGFRDTPAKAPEWYHIGNEDWKCIEMALTRDSRPSAALSMKRDREETMAELRPITEENFIDAFHLKLLPEQERFVSHPIRSLAQAYVYRNQCQPFGIYVKNQMVGYVMVIYDDAVPEYDIWHMMIDASMQGRGYGGEALDRVIDYIKTKPFGDSRRIALTCNKDNAVARRLYERKGFSATGVEDEDEVELVLSIG